MRRLSAKEYYTEASDYYNREDFTTAGEKYQELLDQYPLNPYAEEAQLKIAYGRYLDRKFADALTGFSDFERTYPRVRTSRLCSITEVCHISIRCVQLTVTKA